MKEKQTPRNQDRQSPTREPIETARRLQQKADEQEGGSDRARTKGKARQARAGNGKSREVHFGG